MGHNTIKCIEEDGVVEIMELAAEMGDPEHALLMAARIMNKESQGKLIHKMRRYLNLGDME